MLNMEPIVVLSGRAGVGKTSVAAELVARMPALHAQTSAMILKIRPNSIRTRIGLQEAGNSLDVETDFSWIARETLDVIRENPHHPIIVDAVRVPRQVSKIRTAIPTHVIHIHLTASRPKIIARFMARKRIIDDGLAYETIEVDDSEKWNTELAAISDLVVDTDYRSPSETAATVIDFTKR
ncbi:hypothetical protein HFO98_27350 [Rhizobium leguminosarum]|uniref:hypothetical protein n=1 Tax=Rhizobium leguminosarum TaxID=384 RepID=UPI001C978EDC|nr:hypothetical protein [Rhizobium leguminosarum]MBY5412103.1 hypothetical protein [Rhizobium leguminosarum]